MKHVHSVAFTLLFIHYDRTRDIGTSTDENLANSSSIEISKRDKEIDRASACVFLTEYTGEENEIRKTIYFDFSRF